LDDRGKPMMFIIVDFPDRRREARRAATCSRTEMESCNQDKKWSRQNEKLSAPVSCTY